MSLWKHQAEALKAIRSTLDAGDRARLYMPPGSGKTRVFCELSKDYERVLVLVPSRALITKTVRDLHNIRPETRKLDLLAVCAKGTVKNEDRDALDVAETTDPALIRSYMAEEGPRIVLATYTSCEQVVKAGASVDLAVFDEAHHTAAIVPKGETKKAQALVLSGDIGKRLFVTASPKVHTTANGANKLVTSMDDEALFGPLAFDFSYRKALKARVVKPYKIHLIHWQQDPVRSWQHCRHLAAVAGLKMVREEYKADHVFVFANSIASSERVAKMFSEHFPDDITEHVDANSWTPPARQLLLDDFAGFDSGIISSVRTLNEGVDAPCVDSVIFADPIASVVGVVQAAGRALRKDHANPDAVAHIIVPVIHDTEPKRVKKAMAATMEVLSALGELDETLEQSLRAAKADKRDGPVVSHVPEGMWIPDFQIDDVVRRLALTTFSGGGWDWWQRLEEVKVFVAEHGRPPYQSESSLCCWCDRQRKTYKSKRPGFLTSEQIAALEAIPGWFWEKDYDADWKAKLEEVKAYASEHGRLPIQREGSLGVWCSHQRQAYKSKRPGFLTSEQIAALEGLPGWFWVADRKDWWSCLEELKAFGAEHGRVPTTREGTLGVWCNSQRTTYGGKGNCVALSDDQIAALEAIPGWYWRKQGNGEYCVRGHEYAVTGRYNHNCAECTRENSRKRRFNITPEQRERRNEQARKRRAAKKAKA